MSILSPQVLKKITDEVTDNVKAILGEKIHKIILYGSYARGDAREYSDVDIIVIGDIGDEEKSRYRKAFWRFMSDLDLEYDTIVSVKMENRERFEKYLPALPFYQNVVNDGVVLYVN